MHKLYRSLLLLALLALLAGTAAASALQRVVDKDNLLTEAEEAILSQKIQEITQQYGVDVVLLTQYSLDGKTAEAYADDYYDYNGYGLGEDKSGVLMLVSLEYRDWAVSTTGSCIAKISDRDIAHLADNFLEPLGDGEYYDAFWQFLGDLEGILARPEVPDAEGEPQKESNLLLWEGIALAASGVIAILVVCFMKRNLNTARPQNTADAYASGDLQLTACQDIYLHSTTTRTRRAEESSGHSGSSGGSFHTSSSGTSHGGGSGKF